MGFALVSVAFAMDEFEPHDDAYTPDGLNHQYSYETHGTDGTMEINDVQEQAEIRAHYNWICKNSDFRGRFRTWCQKHYGQSPHQMKDEVSKEKLRKEFFKEDQGV